MRIISGTHKGRRISAPKKLPVRPTTDMAKEALFNILGNRFDLEGLEILDLFAGTGNIGLEFASRGSQQITAVDAHAGCVQFIAKTAQELDLPISAIRSDVFKFLKRAHSKWDIIFADPPYDIEQQQFLSIPEFVFKNELLSEHGLLIVEHSDKTNLSDALHFKEQRKYGGSIFSFFEH